MHRAKPDGPRATLQVIEWGIKKRQIVDDVRNPKGFIRRLAKLAVSAISKIMHRPRY